MAAHSFLDRLGIKLPILQAPMAGVSTPRMAAAVTGAGGLGGLGLGASTPEVARKALLDTRQLTHGAINANFFCHATPVRNAAREAAWIARAQPLFESYEAEPPAALTEIYTSFRDTDAFLDILLDQRPRVASFHFGLPRPDQIAALREAGLILIASATCITEAQQIEAAGFDAVIAQGWEAGGHRGIFDPDGPDLRLSTLDLVTDLRAAVGLPIIAAGGIMDGADIRAALDRGAVAAQLGTAFLYCPESSADSAYRARIVKGGQTVMTAAISGRPARCLTNAFTDWAEGVGAADIPAYPCTYDLGKALNAAARNKGEGGYGAQWAGMGVDRAHNLTAAAIMAALAADLRAGLHREQSRA